MKKSKLLYLKSTFSNLSLERIELSSFALYREEVGLMIDLWLEMGYD